MRALIEGGGPALGLVALGLFCEAGVRFWDWLTLPGGYRSRGARRRHPSHPSNVRRARRLS